mmetsp:Transcript_8080/g.16067  ORF Transcript_8080/g.16067 Transcript_8080/m.16067 type:complete len:225 (+) Transcript_8080:1492-2166(+)
MKLSRLLRKRDPCAIPMQALSRSSWSSGGTYAKYPRGLSFTALRRTRPRIPLLSSSCAILLMILRVQLSQDPLSSTLVVFLSYTTTQIILATCGSDPAVSTTKSTSAQLSNGLAGWSTSSLISRTTISSTAMKKLMVVPARGSGLRLGLTPSTRTRWTTPTLTKTLASMMRSTISLLPRPSTCLKLITVAMFTLRMCYAGSPNATLWNSTVGLRTRTIRITGTD